MKFQKNISERQQLIRIIISSAILVIGWYYDSFWGGLIGVFFLATGILGTCVICQVRGIKKILPQICDKK